MSYYKLWLVSLLLDVEGWAREPCKVCGSILMLHLQIPVSIHTYRACNKGCGKAWDKVLTTSEGLTYQCCDDHNFKSALQGTLRVFKALFAFHEALLPRAPRPTNLSQIAAPSI